MNERDAFIRAIAANLYDDTARLAFADWLDEHGESERAEFIRVQVELEPMRDKYEIPRAAELHEREEKLLKAKKWLDNVPRDWDDWQHELTLEFRRGFPDLLRLSTRRLIADDETFRIYFPTLRRLVVHCLNGRGAALASRKALRGVPELELACWYSDDDITALAKSPHLKQLQVLVLWLGRQIDEATTDASLCRIAAKATAWPNLRELVLLDPQGESEERIKKLVTSANRSAKRKIARYERGYPELFPLAPDFSYGSPGRLPDGRLAFASTKRETRPFEAPAAWWKVRTFDPDGTPRDEVLRVPLPPELLPQDWSASCKLEEQRKKVLTEHTGFVPAFIRVPANALGDDFGPRRGHYDNWDLCGRADDPERPCDRNGDPAPAGYGGCIYWLVRGGQFVVGYNAWADKRGQVHST